jgi:hypothetical protein
LCFFGLSGEYLPLSFAFEHARGVGFAVSSARAVIAVFDAPFLGSAFVEVLGEVFIEIADICSECFVFVAVGHLYPPVLGLQ